MKKSTTPMSCKQFPPAVSGATLWFDNIMQRSYVWEQSRKSELIHSLMCGYPVPFIYARKKTVPLHEVYKRSMEMVGIDKKWKERIHSGKFGEADLQYDKLSESDVEKIKSYYKIFKKYEKALETNETKTIYDVLDGKQRINAITEFILGKYALIGIEEVKYTNADGDEVTLDVNGYSYSDLPDELRENINDFSITFCFIDDATEDELRKLFRKLNNGKPLSTKERNIANCIDISNIAGIGQHEIFDSVLTEKAREKRSQIPIVMKAWCMLNQDIDEVSFAGTDFNAVMMETKTTAEQREELVSVFDRFVAMAKYIVENKERKISKDVLKKMFSETHMISLVPFVKRSIDEKISVEMMADFIVENFSGDTIVSEEYQDASRMSSAKNVSIRRRDSALKVAWEKFFESDEDAEEVENPADAFAESMNAPVDESEAE